MLNILPLISICIPTYNRSFYLNNLLANLYLLDKDNKDFIEVCVSDNHSTDQTQAIISQWRNKLLIKDVIQDENIGGNRNIIEVTRIASGRWILIIGDDDEIVVNQFKVLLKYLQELDCANFVLVGVGNHANEKNLLGKIKSGIYSGASFKNILLKYQLFRFGFIGMYIFRSDLLSILYGLKLTEIYSWPHIGFFVSYLLKNQAVAVYSPCVVIQDALNCGYYWDIDDWVLVNSTKINVINSIQNFTVFNYLFCRLLALVELYSSRNIKELLLWRIIKPDIYNQLALRAYKLIYKSFDFAILFCLPHFIYISLISALPRGVIKWFLYQYGHVDAIKAYSCVDRKNIEKNCINRGPM